MAVNIQKYSLRLVKETGGRYDLESRVVKEPGNAHDIFVKVQDMDKRPVELFALITLDIKNQVTGTFVVSQGGLSNSIVHPRNVFQIAFLQNAAAIILGHNHPSTITEPSQDDIKITQRLISAGDLLGVEVLDHIIVGDKDKYLSMKEKGLI